MIRDFPRALSMLERTLDGATFDRVGREFGLGRARVERLVSWTVRLLLHPDRLQGDAVPDHSWWSTFSRRQYADFWRGQIRKARLILPNPAP